MIVMKFGGTSVGNAECIARAAEIVAASARDGGVVAVVSAMGGVTNRLIDAAYKSEQGDANAGNELADTLRQQHFQAIETLVHDEIVRERLLQETEQIIKEVRGLCRGASLLRELTLRTLDSISSVGPPHPRLFRYRRVQREIPDAGRLGSLDIRRRRILDAQAWLSAGADDPGQRFGSHVGDKLKTVPPLVARLSSHILHATSVRNFHDPWPHRHRSRNMATVSIACSGGGRGDGRVGAHDAI